METSLKFYSSLAALRSRLTMLAATLVAATVGLVAPATAKVTLLSVGPQTGTLSEGTAGSVTYNLVLTRDSSYPSNSSVLYWSIDTLTPLPAGASATWAPVGGWSGYTRTYTMTISTTLATPAGTSNFNVKVIPSLEGQGNASAAGSLAVQAGVQAAQTISFGAIANQAVGDPPFVVNATASSGLAVSFAASGDCTVLGSTVTLGTPATLPGSCTITASQAGNLSYLAAADVLQSFTITAPSALNTFDLYATAGTTSLNGTSMPVWFYNGSSTAPTTVRPGGPTLFVTQGQTVTVALHNRLGENTALLFQGQEMIPDTTGAAPGTTKSYSFTASKPGTYLYEAGLLPKTEHQVAMGLYGALVVRPSASPAQAYTDASTAFNSEKVLVLSEIDPLLNNTIDPSTFDMRDFKPRYFLINGTVYPDTPQIIDETNNVPGNKVLLRYVNAGAKHHSMAMLGARQVVIGEDGSPLQFPRTLVARTIAPGQTADALVTIPATAQPGSKFAIYDGNLMLHNGGVDNAFGGMMTFVKVAGTPSPLDTTGPVTSALAYAAGTLTGTVSDASTGNGNVTAAEVRLDSTAAAATAMTGTFGSPSVNVSATVAVPSGSHTLYVRGRDSLGNWGVFAALAVNGADTSGPTNSALALTPNPTNGSASVVLSATASDTASGGSNIASAQYSMDGGAPVAMTVATPAAPVSSVTATILAATVSALAEGTHVVSVTSTDAATNTGTAATINLIVDKTGPDTNGVNVTPNPNNGTLAVNQSTPAVRVTAAVADTASNVSAAEGFIDTVGANGSGFPLLPVDGQFNAQTENAFADIPLPTIAGLSNGNHTIYVHGRDAAGNWGATSAVVLVIDKVAPTISAATLTPGTIAFGAASVTLNVTADGTGTAVAGGQYWIDGSATPPASPSTFSGTGATINASALAGGTHTVYFRVQDAATNWSAVQSRTVTVVQAVADAKSLNASTTNNTQTQSYNTNASSLLANDFPTSASATLMSVPLKTSGNPAAVMTLTCTSGTGSSTVVGSTICSNGRFTINLSNAGITGNNNAAQAARAAARRGTYTFTYTITASGVTSAPVTVTITVN